MNIKAEDINLMPTLECLEAEAEASVVNSYIEETPAGIAVI